MWKFILFIVIAVVAVWQLGLLEMPTESGVEKEAKVEKKVEEPKVAKSLTPVSSDSLKVSSLKDAFKDIEEPKAVTKTEVITEKKKVVVAKVEVKKEETPKKSNSSSLKVSSLKDSFKGLKDDEIEDEPVDAALAKEIKKASVEKVVEKKVEKKAIDSFVKSTKKSDDYENMLLADSDDIADGKASNAKSVKSTGMSLSIPVAKPQPKKEEVVVTAYEKTLMAEVDDESPVEIKKAPKVEEVNEPSGSNFREKLKNLLASAKKSIDKDVDKSLLKADGDSKVQNSVAIKAKSAKELLEALVVNADKSKSKSENLYVANLLREVTKAKIAVLEVKENYTTIMVKQGDTLSGIATKIYGSSSKYIVIYEANKEVLTNPNQLYIGTILKIPKI